ncbi:hypothetical protein [Campylobacter troglodytis]|uniref:hypothetical protein n=1 Tax=Campylobacter troglodytis TaxID=654363 RepID=UPI0011592E55|nr:hypothetical protein [Campylobacter troglodytis]TQR61022.1 hypothetical protein DMC01_03155 [Campylobacter troglodytis]
MFRLKAHPFARSLDLKAKHPLILPNSSLKFVQKIQKIRILIAKECEKLPKMSTEMKFMKVILLPYT